MGSMLPYIAYMDPMGYIEWSTEAMRSQTLAPSPASRVENLTIDLGPFGRTPMVVMVGGSPTSPNFP